ncbi:MAG: hypothetical protein ABFD98_13430, partial [Syntrophobacteraceae bacterium]
SEGEGQEVEEHGQREFLVFVRYGIVLKILQNGICIGNRNGSGRKEPARTGHTGKNPGSRFHLETTRK